MCGGVEKFVEPGVRVIGLYSCSEVFGYTSVIYTAGYLYKYPYIHMCGDITMSRELMRSYIDLLNEAALYINPYMDMPDTIKRKVTEYISNIGWEGSLFHLGGNIMGIGRTSADSVTLPSLERYFTRLNELSKELKLDFQKRYKEIQESSRVIMGPVKKEVSEYVSEKVVPDIEERINDYSRVLTDLISQNIQPKETRSRNDKKLTLINFQGKMVDVDPVVYEMATKLENIRHRAWTNFQRQTILFLSTLIEAKTPVTPEEIMQENQTITQEVDEMMRLYESIPNKLILKDIWVHKIY